MSKTVLELKNVNKTFGRRKVIDNISLDVKEGEIYGFLGPNGSGKTTTIKMILRLIDSDSGEIKVNGFDTKKQFEKSCFLVIFTHFLLLVHILFITDCYTVTVFKRR